jgi:endonuclease/exonuclease/phosphatase family metal-dependent hydrolase
LIKFYARFLAVFFSLQLAAQQPDVITVMTYNLLNYRNFTNFCPANQNNPLQKEQWLKTIVEHVEPEVLVCQEIGGGSATNADFILTNSLNTGGKTYWQKASYTNNGFSSLVNMLYYDSRKLALQSQAVVSKDLQNNDLVRVLDIYRLYYKDSLLNEQSDTVWFYVVGVHLKAGTTGVDITDRANATAALMQYIASFIGGSVNMVIAGDFNIYRSQEAGYQNLINHPTQTIRFYDPINQPGNWSDNAAFAAIHTQSTRTSQTNGGCFSGGGLDDRLDHIMITDEIRDNTRGMRYIPNSYFALGNDGAKFNQAINNGNNFSVPANVLNAVYNMSDHLPVIAEFEIARQQIGVKELKLTSADIAFPNPVGDLLDINISANGISKVSLNIYDLSGQLLHQEVLVGTSGNINKEIVVGHLPKGLYVLEFKSTQGWQAVKRLMKL